jgi:ADP-ribosyl-[dinitrogen reductase] hydrolase
MTTPHAAQRDRALGAFIGLAVGDAIGTTVEFMPRGSFAPLTDMVGGGKFALLPGQWTDDTSMALCLAESLLHDPSLDELDLMRRFRRWLDHGENSATGRCFDIGVATRRALDRFQASGNPIAGDSGPGTAGNGSVMRLAPVALMHWRTPENARDLAERQGRTTHGAAEAVGGCALLAEVLSAAIAGGGALSEWRLLERPGVERASRGWPPRIRAIASGSWRNLRVSEISSSGYVVHTLSAALWCATRAPNFEDGRQSGR